MVFVTGDLVIASEKAIFSLPEVKRGLCKLLFLSRRICSVFLPCSRNRAKTDEPTRSRQMHPKERSIDLYDQ